MHGTNEGPVIFGDLVCAAGQAKRPGDSNARRDERMAAKLMDEAARQPDALVIALTGNVHASRKVIAEMGTYPLMAMLLPAGETLSLWIADRGGEAWTQTGQGCGPHPFGASGGLRRGVTLSRGEGILAGYDGLLSTGARATASLPAAGNLPPQPACSTDEAARAK
jgi:hypothetical protein